jgi:hypothetical protein
VNEVAIHRAKSIQFAEEARRRTEATLKPLIGDFRLTDWSDGALGAIWENHQFPWSAITNLFPDPDRLELAVWVGDRLVALGLCRTSSADAVIVQVMEGDQDNACPLKGKRALLQVQGPLIVPSGLHG